MYRKEISSNYKEKNKERKRYKKKNREKKSKPRGAANGTFIYV